jgi:hypothetical protein
MTERTTGARETLMSTALRKKLLLLHARHAAKDLPERLSWRAV